jgi:hypothetical protein
MPTKPVLPVENRCLGTVELRLLRRIGFDLMLAGLAPHYEANAGGSGAAKGHRRPRLRFGPPAASSGVFARWLPLAAHIVSAAVEVARGLVRA